MNEVKTLGIDLAKNIFQLHGVNARGKTILVKRVKRQQLSETIMQLPKCLIGMEACGGAHHWARTFQAFGHEVKLMSPQYVKPYVKGNKNDASDAEGICEAVTRPNMRFVPIKNIWSQDIQSIHRIRARLMKQRTALSNEIRGLLSEYGIVIPRGPAKVRQGLPLILEDRSNCLTEQVRDCFSDLREELSNLDEKVSRYETRLKAIYESDPRCLRLGKIPGIGYITATAMVGALGDGAEFKNGRHCSAWLGMVPKQHSSGGKEKLLGISKRGDRYLRGLLVHGARSVLRHLGDKEDRQSRWLRKKIEQRGFNKACVALANKNVRMIWAILSSGRDYDANYKEAA